MSIPKQLAITVLGSGSGGNALVVHDGVDGLLVDAGFAAAEIRTRLARAGLAKSLLRGIIVTHEHIDHVRGIRELSQQLNLPVFATSETSRVLHVKDPRLEPFLVFAADQQFEFAGFTIQSFPVSHDTVDPIGLVISRNGLLVGIATDLGQSTRTVERHLCECDILLVESNHDVKMVHDSKRIQQLKQRILGNNGHLSNQAAMELIAKVLHPRTRYLILAHISRHCNTPALVEHCARECLERLGRPDLTFRLALQDEVLETVWVGQ
jgi:phosphoribosyl 1,2-cyclic phosphodiesterase